MLLRPTRRLLASHSDHPLAPLLIGKTPSPPTAPSLSARTSLKTPSVTKKETTYHFIHRQASYWITPFERPEDGGSSRLASSSWSKEIVDVDVTSIMAEVGVDADKPIFVSEWEYPECIDSENLSKPCLLGETIPQPSGRPVELDLEISPDFKLPCEDKTLFDSPALQDFVGLALKASYEQLRFDLQTEEEWEVLTGNKLGRSTKLSDMLIVRSRFDHIVERSRILEEARTRVKASLVENLDHLEIPGVKKE